MFTKMFTGPLKEVFQVAYICAIFFASLVHSSTVDMLCTTTKIAFLLEYTNTAVQYHLDMRKSQSIKKKLSNFLISLTSCS